MKMCPMHSDNKYLFLLRCIYLVSRENSVCRNMSFAEALCAWHINERCNNAGVSVLTWKVKTSPHMRRCVRNNIK